MKKTPRLMGIAPILVVGLMALVFLWEQSAPEDRSPAAVVKTSPVPGGGTAAESRDGTATGAEMIREAYRTGRSGVVVETEGVVQRTLRDDNEGSRHQRFILEISGGHTVLVAHNIDLATRIPVSRGDAVSVRGQYEWNDQGGVIHWTHHDPDGDRPGGWVRHLGKVYR